MHPYRTMLGRAKELLRTYRSKRRFGETPEPTGEEASTKTRARRGIHRFVVQKHHASRLHYDFRLEAEGVLKSWAIPKGPTLDPSVKRLAMMTEDHPLAYIDFEGVIPSGYGAGEVIVWDQGTYSIVEGEDPARAIREGKIRFRLEGEKLKGLFALVKIRGRKGEENAWLLIKDRDDARDPKWSAEAHSESVITGKTLEDYANAPDAPHWESKAPAAKKPFAERLRKRIGKSSSKAARQNSGIESLPEFDGHMLATLVDSSFDDPNWLFELKWDGFRAIADIDANQVRLTSRNKRDLTDQFPELDTLRKAFTTFPIRVDGEIVTLDKSGRSSFQRLQQRIGKSGAGNREKNPVTFAVFDLLHAKGEDLTALPLVERKRRLAQILSDDTPGLLLSKHVVGEGVRLFETAGENGLEGIVAKRADSPYVARRTRDWLKIKVQSSEDCVVVGYTDPKGAREGFGALLLGIYEEGELRYAGRVGTGFTRTTLERVMRSLEALRRSTSPLERNVPIARELRDVHWVEPRLVAEVDFTEWTDEGLLRHPAFRGLREDKAPQSCIRQIARRVNPKKTKKTKRRKSEEPSETLRSKRKQKRNRIGG